MQVLDGAFAAGLPTRPLSNKQYGRLKEMHVDADPNDVMPDRYQVETHYDANRNMIRAEIEDQWVQYDSDDPTAAGYGHFTPTGSGSTAHVPSRPGNGGALRPGWFTNLMTYDLLDIKTSEDLDATGSSPDRLVMRFEFDPNQNVVKQIKPEGNTVEYDYDERNLQIAMRDGNVVALGGLEALAVPAVTVTPYDANGNLLQTIGPAQRGGLGNQQTVTLEDAFGSGAALVHTGDFLLENTYDGFDRATATTDSVGNVTLAAHDPDGRVLQSTQRGPIGGPTPADRNGTNNVDLTKSTRRFDEAGRNYETQQPVFVAAGTVLPSGNRSVTHTGGGLDSNSTADDHTGSVMLVDASGVSTGNQSYVLNRTVFDRAGREQIIVQDNTGQTIRQYDGANRRIQETDAVGNVMQYEYDGNSNVIFVNRVEKCTIIQPVIVDEVFRAAMRYDSLNRLLVRAEQGANGTLNVAGGPESGVVFDDSETLYTLTGYDSRGNRTLGIDPKRNSVVTVYDGANRMTQTHEHLRIAGLGDNPPEPGTTSLPFGGASIVTTTFYDGNSRTKRLVDDRGDVTAHEYDTLDRETVMQFHDGSTRQSVYNEAGDVVRFIDENSSVMDNTYDALGRKTQCDVTKAAGVVGTDRQTFEYDGLSRQTMSVDTVGSTRAVVQMSYDSLKRVIEDTQTYFDNARSVTHTEFASLPVGRMAYPNGREIENDYDLLYRRTKVSDVGGDTITTWQFFGPARVAEMVLGNGLICTHLNNARTRSAVQEDQTDEDWHGQVTPPWGDQSSDRLGYDGAGRMITKRYLTGGLDPMAFGYLDTTPVVGFTTAYDHSSNKLFERHLHAESRSHLYEPFVNQTPQGGYDSLNRLRQYHRGILSATGGRNNLGGGGIETPISLPNTDVSRTYDLDGLGNWRRTTFEPVGGSETAEIRQHNALNQITRRDVTPFSYDLNGNLLDDGDRLYTWDAFNRLSTVRRKSDGLLIGHYTYDARAFRIRKVVSNGGLTGDIPNGTTDFLYNSDWQCLEERDDANNPTKQYVWGIYIDELLQQRLRTIDINSPRNDYPLSDLLYRTTALTDEIATITETYDIDAYGNTIIFKTPGVITGGWADDASQGPLTCDFVFTQRRLDVETRLYAYRTRYFAAPLGRFVSRDHEGSLDNINQYAFVRNNPISHVDPFGKYTTVVFTSICKCTDGGGYVMNTACTQFELLVNTVCYGAVRNAGLLTCASFCGAGLRSVLPQVIFNSHRAALQSLLLLTQPECCCVVDPLSGSYW